MRQSSRLALMCDASQSESSQASHTDDSSGDEKLEVALAACHRKRGRPARAPSSDAKDSEEEHEHNEDAQEPRWCARRAPARFDA